jgi:hypothetical protein
MACSQSRLRYFAHGRFDQPIVPANIALQGATMDRALRRSILVRLWALSALTLAAGCSLLPTIAYIIKPEDVSAAFDGLNGKRVAVICRAASLEYADPTVARDLAVRVGALLEEHGRKIDIVDERELADWVDKHDWHDYREVGRALKADMVVGIDLERFALSRGSTLLQGQADLRLAVYDVESGQRRWEPGRPLSVKFPPNSPYSSSDRKEEDFRRQFLDVLAERVARHFYAYDSRKDVALDSTVLH